MISSLHSWSFQMKFIKLAEARFINFIWYDHSCKILYFLYTFRWNIEINSENNSKNTIFIFIFCQKRFFFFFFFFFFMNSRLKVRPKRLKNVIYLVWNYGENDILEGVKHKPSNKVIKTWERKKLFNHKINRYVIFRMTLLSYEYTVRRFCIFIVKCARFDIP